MIGSTNNKFAVVGVGGIFPGAADVETYWRNIIEKRVLIERLPPECIEREVFFRPDVLRRSDKGDRSYTDLYATIKHIDFKPGELRIPPTVAAHMDDNQKLSLLAAREAISFGGLDSVSKDRVAVFMGNSMIGQRHHDFAARFNCDKFAHYLRRHPVFAKGLSAHEQQQVLSAVRERIIGHTAQVTEDTAPGILPNIIAARINSVFDLHGHAYVIDAACASGLAAIICGVQQLRLGEVDAVICGAADIHNEELGRIYFCALGVLSPDGSFPFDERANGFVIGDGAGAVVIKRLDDALAASDRIFCVIAGYGQASDGKGKAIAAPNEVWQAEVIKRAWKMAGAPADTVALIEAHGTSTQVGDISEVKALKRSFAMLGAMDKNACGIGSVKSNIGHLKSAAGIAGFIKAVLALDRRILPPSAGFEKENPKLSLGDSPFYVVTEARDWPEKAHPRRAGVSAFGFGGADYHLALEEYRAHDYSGQTSRHFGSSPNDAVQDEAARGDIFAAANATAPQTPNMSEALLFSGEHESDVLAQLESLIAELKGASATIPEQIVGQNLNAQSGAPVRLALVFHSVVALEAQAATIRQWMGQPSGIDALHAKGVAVGTDAPLRNDQVALMFPGQGAQYANMLQPLVVRSAAADQLFRRADILWRRLAGHGISELIDASTRGDEETELLLRQTQNTHPALVTSSLATFRILEEMGLVPGALIGHSVGELTALAAAKRLSFGDALSLVHARGTSFSEVPEGLRGGMIALPLSVGEARGLLDVSGVDLAIANVNSPVQTIVSGDEGQVSRLLSYCKENGIKASRLKVSHGFHSPLMAPAEHRFQAFLERTEFQQSDIKVIANQTNEYYAEQSASVRETLRTQITGSVHFAASIERLYADGARLFVEVGPGSVLSTLVRRILNDKKATVISSDDRRGDSLDAFWHMVCGLFAAGIPIDPTLATRRDVGGIVSYPSPAISAQPPADISRMAIVYSGVSVGLPGAFKECFRDDNFEQLFEGKNLIERLSDHERRQMVDLNISKVVKSEEGASFAALSSLNEVIQFAGKLGALNLVDDYQIEHKDVANMSNAIAAAVAAGYEALRDARIPLVHEYAPTLSGALLPERWALPKDMQQHTGVIFANGFPMVDPIIREVSRHLSCRLGNRAREALFEFYDSLIARVTDRESRKLLLDWYTSNHERLGAVPGPDEVYHFNHNLMTQIAMQANNRLASYINARGPNFQINGACSSTATAITLAESLIRTGRAKRMIVIGGDDPTSKEALPYLGAGFLSSGACTNSGDLYSAAIPFDKRRSGMIMGSGAVGIVVESDTECSHRGIVPVCELLGSHCFNTAGHSSQLDIPRYAEELDVFMSRMEATHGLSREKMAKKLVYLSHETYTPPRGGCSEAEAVALQHVFKSAYRTIEVGNTKGMTGHTMGASIEDAVAAKSLQFGKVPPVVNHKVVDSVLDGLKLSKGGRGDFEYALRMAAGFGSQGNYILLRRRARGDARVVEPATHSGWLREISGNAKPELTYRGRILSVTEGEQGEVLVDRPYVASYPPCRRSSVSAPVRRASAVSGSAQPVHVSSDADVRLSEVPIEKAEGIRLDGAQGSAAPDMEIRTLVFDVVAKITGYDASILELDMDLEADLGIDTVKQATVLATLSERLGLADLSELRLSEYPTIAHIVALYEEGALRASKLAAFTSSESATPMIADSADRTSTNGARENQRRDTLKPVFEVISHVTGYGLSILEETMELEADLGIDTVKQATILAMLAERFGVEDDAHFTMSDFATIRQLIDFFSEFSKEGVAAARNEEKPARASLVSASAPRRNKMSLADVTARLYKILGELTPYPSDMLEPDLTLESDLALNAEIQKALRLTLIDDFGLPGAWTLPDDSSLGELCENIWHTVASSGKHRHEAEALGRQVLALRPALNDTGESYELARKRVWVLGDESRCVGQLAARLGHLGCETSMLVFPSNLDTDPLGPAIDGLLSAGRPDLVIDVTASPKTTDIVNEEPKVVLPAIERAMDGRFAVCKRLAEPEWQPKRILAVTALDGSFALKNNATSDLFALYGLHMGFYKAVRKEWPNCAVSILDLPPSAWAGDGLEAIHGIERELASPGPGVEVCYVNGERHRVIVEDSAWPEVAPTEGLNEDEVVVVTGGGTGVTAKIVLALARRCPCKFALIGRTALDPEAKSLMFADVTTLTAKKSVIQKRLVTAGERVTPVSIERAFSRLAQSGQIYETIASLEQAGSKASYFQADVCDLDALSAALSKVRRQLGPITTVIHGAGIEISHRLEKKSAEEFRRVHSVKSVGAYHLNWLCRKDPLRRFVSLSSISGRFGNAAQTDYSGANSFLDLLARTERRPGVRATSLLWSGWGELGMAWRNGFVREHAELSGLNFISPDVGADAAAAEICAPSGPAEIVIHRGLRGVIDPAFSQWDLCNYPLIDWIEKRDDLVIASHRRFSVQRDAFLDQHRLGVVPLMPGVGYMEMMAQTASLLEGASTGGFIFRQLEFMDAFKLHREEPRDIRLDITRDGVSGSRRFQMTARSLFASKLDNHVEMRDYCRAVVEAQPRRQAPPVIPDLDIQFEHEMSYSEALEAAAKTHQQNVYFGPLFNDAKRTNGKRLSSRIRWSEQGIETWVPFPQEQLTHAGYPLERFVINPAFLDALHQAGAFLAIQLTGQVYLPVGADEFVVSAAPNRDGRYRVTAKLKHLDEKQAIYDMVMVWEDDLCCATILSSRFRRIHQ